MKANFAIYMQVLFSWYYRISKHNQECALKHYGKFLMIFLQTVNEESYIYNLLSSISLFDPFDVTFQGQTEKIKAIDLILDMKTYPNVTLFCK